MSETEEEVDLSHLDFDPDPVVCEAFGCKNVPSFEAVRTCGCKSLLCLSCAFDARERAVRYKRGELEAMYCTKCYKAPVWTQSIRRLRF